MKKCKFFYLLLGIVLGALLCGCDKKPQETPGAEPDKNAVSEKTPEAVYSELVDDIRELILAEDRKTDNELAEQALGGIVEAGYSKTPEETLEVVGYVFQDLNADGMPELIVGGINGEQDGKYWGSDIFAVYTCVQEKIYCICSGWSRSYVGWMGENTFYYAGSAGALYSSLGLYELLPHAVEWSCIDLYFTDENGVYHNQTGIYDAEYAEPLEMTEEEFWALDEAFNDKVLEFELTPFSNYGT